MYCNIIRQENETAIRVIDENDDFLAVCPYAPRFPFESWLIPKNHASHFKQTAPKVLENLSPLLG